MISIFKNGFHCPAGILLWKIQQSTIPVEHATHVHQQTQIPPAGQTNPAPQTGMCTGITWDFVKMHILIH